MIQAQNISRGLLASVVCLLLLPAVAFAAEPVGHMSPSPSAVQWQPGVENEGIVLRVVAPDGTVFTKEFPSGSAPSFRLQDLGNGKVTDGVYSYELLVVPRISQEVKKQLTAARAADDDAAVERIQKAAGIGNALKQSGTLTVANGVFLNSDAVEPSQPTSGKTPKVTSNAVTSGKITPNDDVIADDLIVQGSACVGLDCVNNESFGFDTLRLKENNTRIKFEDTSTSTGFPTHDWQLTANDSASGGAEKFSIEDITAATVPFTVTGSSPNNSIFVASNGKVGFRTSTPGLDLHISTGDTPAIRQEQTNASGFTAQTWDIGANEANWFVRDVTSGSRLPLRIRPGAPTSSIDISASGKVGVGTASPVANLDVRGTNAHSLLGSGTTDFLGASQTGFEASNGTEKILFGLQTGLTFLGSNSTTNLAFLTNNSTKVVIDTTGNVGIGTLAPGSQLVIANGGTTSSINAGATQFTVASSRTFKENIAPVDVPDILKKIEAVPVVTYDFKASGPKNRLGLIAEDFHQVFQRGDDKHIDGQEVQMALWMAVQKLTAENKALTDRLSKLESALAQQQKPQD
jgi:Chaperone of endosialidase